MKLNGSEDEHSSQEVLKRLVRTGSLVNYFSICNDFANSPDFDAEQTAWLFAYVRLFSIRDIRVSMRHNYQVKDISHIQDVFSMTLSRAYVDSFRAKGSNNSPLQRALLRNIISFTPRGGGNGDEVRLFILDVMRRNGIREGHRPGIEDPFLEQWHQKLHSSSTPEDITICEAYILFQETNSADRFYSYLWERGGISIEFLKNMSCPLTHGPRYMPQLVSDLKHLLWLLKKVHGGPGNLGYLIEMSKWQLDGELVSMLSAVQNNFGAWWLPGKIIDCRKWLNPVLRNNCPRDPLMIDVALDNLYKTSIERLDLRALKGNDIIELILLTLDNIYLSCDDQRIGLCRSLWQRTTDARPEDKWSQEWALQAFAALSYTQLMLQSCMDDLYEILQTKAQAIGHSCNIDNRYTDNFAEEVIRSQNSFGLSKLLDALSPVIRNAANIGSWKIVSHGGKVPCGRIRVEESLAFAQGLEQKEQNIVIVDRVDGTEDIPSWVRAVLTPDDVDILSHIAIRCRNSKTILATCYDTELLKQLKSYGGKSMQVFVENNELFFKEPAAFVKGPEVAAKTAKMIERRDAVSSKSSNLVSLINTLPVGAKIPPGAVLEPEMLDATLHHNARLASEINDLESKLYAGDGNQEPVLEAIRRNVEELSIPAGVVSRIQEKLVSSRIVSSWSDKLEGLLCLNVKKVWASIWNDRAWHSRMSRGVRRDSVRMGVLIQEAIPAQYSFINHTRNPVSGNPDEMLTQIAVGLGETLTGNSPGAPLSIVSKKGARGGHRIISYPSKVIAFLIGSGEQSLIARSDSNDEDLSGFAGAGLYDSFFVNPPSSKYVSYNDERLLQDDRFQREFFDSVVKIAEEIETVMQRPQDIEGVFSNNNFYIVQTRDQVG